MYLNGESLLRLSFRERRELLRKHFVRVENKFDFVASLDAAGNPEQLDAVCNFFQQSIDRGCEGIMVKVLDHPPGISEKSQMNESDSNGKISNRSRHLLATYEPGKLSSSCKEIVRLINADDILHKQTNALRVGSKSRKTTSKASGTRWILW